MVVEALYNTIGLGDGQAADAAGRPLLLDFGKGIWIMFLRIVGQRVFEDRAMKKMTMFGLIGLAVGALALFGLKWAQRFKSASSYKS
jgi:hypothetical protein